MTIPTFQNVIINALPSITFIGGSYKELNFHVYSSASVALNLCTSEPYWTLSPYNQTDYVALTKSGVCYVDHFTIVLNDADTENLSGKYIQRPMLRGVLGYEYRLGQGEVNIIARIGIT
jgi:hypothetical protein